jgi:uncharacterized protein (TIGR02996 family)
MIESDFVSAINADPDDRTMQLIYADWLDGQDDPRAEGWRVLIEAGKRPDGGFVSETKPFGWFLGGEESTLPCDLFDLLSNDEDLMQLWYEHNFPTFHAAMDAAAVAWSRSR